MCSWAGPVAAALGAGAVMGPGAREDGQGPGWARGTWSWFLGHWGAMEGMGRDGLGGEGR